MAAPALVCPTCRGDRTDPDDPGEYDHAVHMHDPYSRGPCPTCNGTGVQDFGHVPFFYDGVDICMRCWTRSDPWSARSRGTVPWPCASAVVLGLTPTT